MGLRFHLPLKSAQVLVHPKCSNSTLYLYFVFSLGVSHADVWKMEDEDVDNVGSVEAYPNAVHYFAIGSMTNRTALLLRDITPISSQAAFLPGYRLLFRGSGGMATVERVPFEGFSLSPVDAVDYPFEGVHGVLHLLTAAQMKLMDEFEGGYFRRPCVVRLPNGTEVKSSFYQMDRRKWAYTPSSNPSTPTSSLLSLAPIRVTRSSSADAPIGLDALPTARYLDIIAQGCATHGVDPQWIQFLRGHRCIPRKSSADFVAFVMTSSCVPILSWTQARC